MNLQEPDISVGIVEHVPEIRGTFNGRFEVPTTVQLRGPFTVRCLDGCLVLFDDEGVEVMKGEDIRCKAKGDATFTLNGVTIGINFHWERKEDQTFEGDVRFVAATDGSMTAINEIGVED